MSRQLRVSLGQIRPVLGDVQQNLDKHLAYIKEAKNQSDIIVFPELGLTGYQLQDLTLDVAMTLDCPPVQRLVTASQDIDIVFSFVEESADHRFYIAAVYASQGRILHVHRKVYLPTYGMFDEGRYFAAGDGFQVAETSYGKVGLLVCEDAWHMSSPYLLSLGGADLMIVTSAGPARSVTDQDQFGSQRFWRDLLQVYARLTGTFIVFVNRVGFEDGISFFGGSFVISPFGEWVAEAPSLEETMVTTVCSLDEIRRARYMTPILRDEKRHLVLRELNRQLHQPVGGGQTDAK